MWRGTARRIQSSLWALWLIYFHAKKWNLHFCYGLLRARVSPSPMGTRLRLTRGSAWIFSLKARMARVASSCLVASMTLPPHSKLSTPTSPPGLCRVRMRS